MSYKIITDATSDLPLALAQQWGVEVLPMDYTLDGQPHTYAPGNSDLPLPEIFNAMRNGAVAVTSQINAFSFTKAFEPYLQQGLDIIYIGFSSALSGTVASAGIAKAELLEKYPGRRSPWWTASAPAWARACMCTMRPGCKRSWTLTPW